MTELFKRENRLAHPGWYEPEVQIEALSHLAWAMQMQGEGAVFPLETAKDAMPERLMHKGEDVRLNPATLIRFGKWATVLDPGAEPEVRFYHQLLQEYLAARRMLRLGTGELDAERLWKQSRLEEEMPPATVGEWDPLPGPSTTGWEETTLLACGLADDPGDLVEKVLERNPALAGRCAHEAGHAFPGAVTEKVKEALLADFYDPRVHLRARLNAGTILGLVGDPRFAPEVRNGVNVIIPELVPVPGGTYRLGSKKGDKDAFEDEIGGRPVVLSPFRIGRWPATNAEYGCFVDAGGYRDERYWLGVRAKAWLRGEEGAEADAGVMELWTFLKAHTDWKEEVRKLGYDSPERLAFYERLASMEEQEVEKLARERVSEKSRREPQYWQDTTLNNPSQPVTGITWYEARAYCAWLSAVTGGTYRLPSEIEWEAAARGKKGLRYPWGNRWKEGLSNTIEGRVSRPSPVGAYAARGGVGTCGAEDQAGNVWEWTSTLYAPYPYDPGVVEDPEKSGQRVLRGGSWFDNRRLARCANRSSFTPEDFDFNVGFRVVSPGF